MPAQLRILLTPFTLVALLATAPAVAVGACDISDLPCWGDDTKCNIKIINNTGKSSGSGGTHFNQTSWAVTIKAKALMPNGTRAGSNTLEILAGQSKTLNLDKKDGFDRLEIFTSTGKGGNVTIQCDDIREILENDKNCKVLVDRSEKHGDTYYYFAYNCGVAWGEGDIVWVW